MCRNRARAAARRRPRADGATAASVAPQVVAEFVENITNPGCALSRCRPSSLDRCRWRCGSCGGSWEATVVNRVMKGSGCPHCAPQRWAASRRRPKSGRSLEHVAPLVAAQFVENLTVPGREPAQLAARANDLCRWRCRRGHEWVTTPASRVAGAGCARCAASGRSLFEYQVAFLLAAATGSLVRTDVPIVVNGRTWRVDLEVVDAGLLIDLDPSFWHAVGGRDARKSAAMAKHDYIRIRPAGLPALHVPVVEVPSACEDPFEWALALRAELSARRLNLRDLGEREKAAALSEAFTEWRSHTDARPVPSALDVAPHLVEELVRNLTHPEVGLDWLSPSARDKCEWQCRTCGHVWSSSVGSRAYARTGCPPCAAAAGRARSLAPAGQSLKEQHPLVAAELVRCDDDRSRDAASLRPASNLRCTWRCGKCQLEFRATPADRSGGRGCPRCGKERTRRARIAPEAGASLADLAPKVAAEFLACLNEPALAPADLCPASNKKCRWRCADCSHQWEATPATRTVTGCGCPSCGRASTGAARAAARPGKTLAELFPKMAGEFVENLTHGERTPETLKAASHDRCRWRCRSCGGEWVTAVKNRARNGTGCPNCHRQAAKRLGTVSG